MTLIENLRSQIGDDIQHVFDHKALFRLAADRIEELEAEVARLVTLNDQMVVAWGEDAVRAEAAEAKLATAHTDLRAMMEKLK